MRMYKKERKYPQIVTKFLLGTGAGICVVALSFNGSAIAQSKLNSLDCTQYLTEALQQEKLKLVNLYIEDTKNIIEKNNTYKNNKNNLKVEELNVTDSKKVTDVEKPNNEKPQNNEKPVVNTEETPNVEDTKTKDENVQESNIKDKDCDNTMIQYNNLKTKKTYTSRSDLNKSIEDILRKYKNQGNSSNNQGSNNQQNNNQDPSKQDPKESDTSNQDTNKPVSKNYNSDYAYQVLDIVNNERAKAGLSPLSMNQKASQAAQIRAKEIVSSFSHTRLDGSSPFTALDGAGVSYRTAGENIAYGQSSPTEVMNGWMNSSGHRANILKGDFKEIGIAAYYENGRYYWVQLFIG